MQYKAGVQTKMELQPSITGKVGAIDDVHLRVAKREAICTSALEGKHRSGSLHYRGHAIDLRTNDLPLSTKYRLLEELRSELGDGYDIIIEHVGRPQEHIHLEWDPK